MIANASLFTDYLLKKEKIKPFTDGKCLAANVVDGFNKPLVKNVNGRLRRTAAFQFELKLL